MLHGFITFCSSVVFDIAYIHTWMILYSIECAFQARTGHPSQRRCLGLDEGLSLSLLSSFSLSHLPPFIHPSPNHTRFSPRSPPPIAVIQSISHSIFMYISGKPSQKKAGRNRKKHVGQGNGRCISACEYILSFFINVHIYIHTCSLSASLRVFACRFYKY